MKVLDYDGLDYYNQKIESMYAPLASPAFTGTPTSTTPSSGDDSTKIATTAYVQAELADYAELTDLNDYLPLSGGTMTGVLVSNNSAEDVNGYFSATGWGTCISVDSSTYADMGANLTLNSKIPNSVNQGGSLGYFVLDANDGTDSSRLIGRPNGSLTWNSKEILTEEGGTLTGNIVLSSGAMVSNYNNTTAMRFVGGDATNGYAGKPRIALFGNNYSSSSLAGVFALVADNSTNNCILNGYPNGDLKWDSKEVERVQASGTNYIRFVSGLQICWGIDNTTTSGHTYNFPVSFNTSPKVVFTVGNTTESNSSYSTKVTNLSKTSFKGIRSNVNNNGMGITCTYIAIGYWN